MCLYMVGALVILQQNSWHCAAGLSSKKNTQKSAAFIALAVHSDAILDVGDLLS